jgi:hypothetical protein
VNIVLFTWNPDRWDIPERQWDREIRQIRDCGFLYSQWSVGNSIKLVKSGDIALLLRQTRDRGIVAKGTVTSEVFEELTWNAELEEDATDHYVEITWTTQLSIADRLTIEDLQTKLPEVSWVRYSSGTTVEPQFHKELIDLWDQTVSKAGQTPGALPSHISASETLIAAQNGFCAVCGLHPKTMYQTAPKTFLTVHTFSTTSTQIAVCPNCQLFASKFSLAQTTSELQQLITGQF